MAAEKKGKQQVHSVWCPNCGIPRNTAMPLKTYLRLRKKSVVFVCGGCGLKIEMGPPGKKEKKKPDDEFGLKDVQKIKQTLRTLSSLGGGGKR